MTTEISVMYGSEKVKHKILFRIVGFVFRPCLIRTGLNPVYQSRAFDSHQLSLRSPAIEI